MVHSPCVYALNVTRIWPLIIHLATDLVLGVKKLSSESAVDYIYVHMFRCDDARRVMVSSHDWMQMDLHWKNINID